MHRRRDMKTGILLQLAVDRARSLDRILGEWEPEIEGKAAALDRLEQQYEALLPAVLELERDIERGYEWEYDRAVRGELDASALLRARDDIEEVFRLSFRNLGIVLRFLHDFERAAGRPLPHRADIVAAREANRKQAARLAAEWPVCTEEEASEALAAAARGEAIDLDDAFAQIAGVDRATWLERVTAHKGGSHGSGQE
jgi:hypothetical protein